MKPISLPSSGIMGFYEIDILQGDTVVRSYKFPNKITNLGLERFGGYTPQEHHILSDLAFCHLGDGTTLPTYEDVQLESFLALSSSREPVFLQYLADHVQEIVDLYPDLKYGVLTKYYYIFPVGTATGIYSEIGIGGPAPDSLFSRALISDLDNKQALMQIKETESARVGYSFIQLPPLDDVPFEIDLGESFHTGIIRAAAAESLQHWGLGDTIAGPSGGGGIIAYSGGIGAIYGSPYGNQSTSETAYTVGEYVPGSFSRMGFAWFKNNQGNFPGGIKSILVHCKRGQFSVGGSYQLSFEPPIMKSDTQELRLYWNVEWGRGPELPPPSPPPSPSDLPEYISAVISADGSKIILTYGSEDDASTAAERIVFTVSDNTVTSTIAVGVTVELTLGTPFAPGTTIAIGGTGNSGGTGGTGTTYSDPTLVNISTSADKTQIILTYDSPESAAIAIAGTYTVEITTPDFTRSASISGKNIVGSTVVLTLEGSVPDGATFSITHNGASIVITGTGGSGTDPTYSDPTLIGIEPSDDGTQVTLTYDSPESAATAFEGTFTVKVGGVNVAVTDTNLVGSTIVLTLAEPSTGIISVTRKAPPGTADPGDSAPVFIMASVGTNRSRVILTYDRPLDAVNKAPPNKFVVMVDGVANTVTSTIVVGSTIELTLTNDVADGAVVTVSYTDPTFADDPNATQSASGIDAASFTNVTATNGNVSPVDWLSVSVDGYYITLTYDSHESAANAWNDGEFAVKVNGVDFEIYRAEVKDATMVLTVESSFPEGSSVFITYTRFDDVDTKIPSFISAETNQDGTKVILIYDEYLDVTDMAEIGAFVVKVGGSSITISAVTVIDNTVELTVNPAIVVDDVVTVGYTDPTADNDINAIQDDSGNDAATLPSTTNVNNRVPRPGDALVSISPDRTQVILTFDSNADAEDAKDNEFIVNVNGSIDAITETNVVGSTVVLTLSTPIPDGASVNVTNNGTTPGGVITDPTLISVDHDGYDVTLTYDSPESAATAFEGTYTVTVDGVNVAVTDTNLVGSTVVLTLVSAPSYSASVNVIRTPPGGVPGESDKLVIKLIVIGHNFYNYDQGITRICCSDRFFETEAEAEIVKSLVLSFRFDELSDMRRSVLDDTGVPLKGTGIRDSFHFNDDLTIVDSTSVFFDINKTIYPFVTPIPSDKIISCEVMTYRDYCESV
jgi:uncharacterized repeat protein (TIGR02059 family)